LRIYALGFTAHAQMDTQEPNTRVVTHTNEDYQKAGEKLTNHMVDYLENNISHRDAIKMHRIYVCLRNPRKDPDRGNIFTPATSEVLDQLVVKLVNKLESARAVTLLLLGHKRCGRKADIYIDCTCVVFVYQFLKKLNFP
jgi:hypothetical protein